MRQKLQNLWWSLAVWWLGAVEARLRRAGNWFSRISSKFRVREQAVRHRRLLAQAKLPRPSVTIKAKTEKYTTIRLPHRKDGQFLWVSKDPTKVHRARIPEDRENSAVSARSGLGTHRPMVHVIGPGDPETLSPHP